MKTKTFLTSLFSLSLAFATSSFAQGVRGMVEVSAGGQAQFNGTRSNGFNILMGLSGSVNLGGNRCERADALCRAPELSQWVIARVRARAGVRPITDGTPITFERLMRTAEVDFVLLQTDPNPQTTPVLVNETFGRYGYAYGLHLQMVRAELLRDENFLAPIRARLEAIGVEGHFQTFPTISAGYFLDFAVNAVGYRFQQLRSLTTESNVLNQHAIELGSVRFMNGMRIAGNGSVTASIGIGAQSTVALTPLASGVSLTADVAAIARLQLTFSRWLRLEADFISRHRLTTGVDAEYAGAMAQEANMNLIFNYD